MLTRRSSLHPIGTDLHPSRVSTDQCCNPRMARRTAAFIRSAGLVACTDDAPHFGRPLSAANVILLAGRITLAFYRTVRACRRGSFVQSLRARLRQEHPRSVIIVQSAYPCHLQCSCLRVEEHSTTDRLAWASKNLGYRIQGSGA